MECPHCQSGQTSERPERTELGYRRFRCLGCRGEFKERTGTPARLELQLEANLLRPDVVVVLHELFEHRAVLFLGIIDFMHPPEAQALGELDGVHPIPFAGVLSNPGLGRGMADGHTGDPPSQAAPDPACQFRSFQMHVDNP